VEKLLYDFKNGNSFLYNRVWQLIVLHKWLSEHSS
jgi:hypothetical protein